MSSFMSPPKAAVSFSGFGSAFGSAPSAATGGTSFGGFGQAPTSATTGSAFGATPSNSFPAFGGGAPSSTGAFGLSKPAGTPTGGSNIFGTNTPASFGAAGGTLSLTGTGQVPVLGMPNYSQGGQGRQQIVSQQQLQQNPAVTMETRFNELPENAKKAFERVHNEFKKPMRDGLDEIARAKLNVLEQLEGELRRAQLAVVRLESRQQQLHADVRVFHDEAKTNLRDVRRFGSNGLQQIQNRGGLSARGYTIGENLPIDFYLRVAEKVEQRLVICMEEIRDLSQQITAAVGAVSEANRKAAQLNGLYGQQSRIGAKEIVQLIKHQSEAFQRVAANVAAVHEQTELLKNWYMSQNPGGADPFDAADREEAARARMEAQRLRDEEARALGINLHQQQQQQQQGQNQFIGFNTGVGGAATATPAASAPGTFGTGFGAAGFGSSATTAAPTVGGAFGSSFGGGAFGSPAGITSATPGGFGGFGTSNTAAAPAANPFGATTAGGTSAFGGFGAAPAAGAAGGSAGTGFGGGFGSGGGFGAGAGGSFGFGAPAATPTTTSSSAFGLGTGATNFGSSHGVKALDLATPASGFGAAPSAAGTGFGAGFGATTTFGGFSTATHTQERKSGKKK